ncbi:MAG: hypothetical protein M3Y08_05445 [Fibrobacterota bacterium]|nr:hypothetical protein [Fibrobacterota bacterium]
MGFLKLFSFFSLSVLLAACFDSPKSTAPESNPTHFDLQYETPNRDLIELGKAAQSGRPFTATIRISNPAAGLGKVSSNLSESEAVDIQVRFTGEEYLVQDPDAGDWVTLTQILAEEIAEEGQDVLAKVANSEEPLELPDKTVIGQPDNTDVIILAGTAVAGAGYVLFKAAKWGWKKLFSKKKPAIRDPGIKIDKKISDQMQNRGWDENSVQETIKNPHKTAKAVDRTANNEPATAYFNKDGHHVVRNDKTGRIVQVSDKNDPLWKPDPSFRD